MTGENPHKLMERWAKEGKGDWERISEAFPEFAGFVESFFSGEGFKVGWESGYYKCLWQCMFTEWHVLPPPIITKGAEKLIETSLKHGGANWIARIYYTLTDARFTAIGARSTTMVPRLAGKITLKFSKIATPIGWALLDFEIFKCAWKCTEKTLLEE